MSSEFSRFIRAKNAPAGTVFVVFASFGGRVSVWGTYRNYGDAYDASAAKIRERGNVTSEAYFDGIIDADTQGQYVGLWSDDAKVQAAKKRYEAWKQTIRDAFAERHPTA